ncbi:hypothetical protein QBC34DRAFT_487271 [Podospora aff. communis PSN243]|uniref:Uncharacterized protein n=1 Tax=Podospora aff. communis PSN243 TaxID=3040156 RepID=A0AAV9GDE2_9PEZI|nr:hypothetical protein QBC34DRAFT_487271 [Podospora aff. communis PSN243]
MTTRSAAAHAPESLGLGPYPWQGSHQYQPVESDLDEEPRSVSPLAALPVNESPRTSTSRPATSENADGGDCALRWTPPYLGRIIISTFILVFAAILIAIQVLLAYSNKHDGIATGYDGQQYLWTYGPTAVLTLVAAVWSRVEYQSKLIAPWARLSKQPPARADRTLLLDYLSDFLPYSVFKAAKNKDFLVSAASLVTILVKILIIVSTGLITLSWTPVRMDSYPMTLQAQFVDDASRLGIDALPFYMMTGTVESNLSYPDGVYRSYAFPSVQSNLPEDAETRVTADAFQSSLDCQPASLNLTWGGRPLDPHYVDAVLNFTVSWPGCHAHNVSVPAPSWTCGRADNCTRVFARFTRVQCNGTEHKNTDIAGGRMLLVMGNISWTTDLTRNETHYTGAKKMPALLFKLTRSTQMVCTPSYALHKVEVLRNGTKTLDVIPLPDSKPQSLNSISAWDIMKAHDQSHSISGESLGGSRNSYSGLTVKVSETFVDVDPYSRLAVLTQNATHAAVASLMEPERLQSLFTNYYQQITALIARQSLMEPAAIPVTGSAIVYGNRLIIRTWAAQWMAGMLAACILLSLVIFFVSPRRVLPCSPSTLFGLAALLQRSPAFLRRLRFSGAADEKGLRGVLGDARFVSRTDGRFAIHVLDGQNGEMSDAGQLKVKSLRAHPGIVHPATRIGLGAILVGLVVALELLLQKSINEKGLGDVGDDTYLHYTWTTIPAVVLGTLAIVFSSMDFRMRAIAPYAAMKRGVHGADAFMSLEFLDSSIPRAVFREVKLRNLGALMATLALVVSSVLTVFSASLFQPAFVEVSEPVSLSINESFSATPDAFTVGRMSAPFLTAGLIFESNMSFPKFTYGDMAFPTFKLASGGSTLGVSDALGGYDPQTIPIHAVIPAVRSKLHCRSYDRSQMELNYTTNATAPASADYPNTLGVWIVGEDSCISPEKKNTSSFPPTIQHISALGCNTTYEALDVNVTFLGTSLTFDPDNPPIPLEHTVRNTTANSLLDFTRPYAYFELPHLNTQPDLLDQYFAAITTSRWAVPRSALGSPEMDQAVQDAVILHDGIIQAQLFAYARVGANATNATIPDPQEGQSDDKLVFTGTVTNARATRRVQQDVISTRILEALLVALFVLLFAGWVFARGGTAVLGSSPTTIAARAAVIAGGNLVGVLPRDAVNRGKEEVKGALGGERVRVWVGWDRSEKGGDADSGRGTPKKDIRNTWPKCPQPLNLSS